MGTHESFERKGPDVEGSSNRSFGLVFTVLFLIIACWPLIKGGEIRTWSLYVAGGFLIPSLVFPVILTPLNKLWTKFGLLLHKVMSPLILGLLFFATVTPIGILMRMTGKDPMNLKLDDEAESYWIERTPPGPDPKSLKNQF